MSISCHTEYQNVYLLTLGFRPVCAVAFSGKTAAMTSAPAVEAASATAPPPAAADAARSKNKIASFRYSSDLHSRDLRHRSIAINRDPMISSRS